MLQCITSTSQKLAGSNIDYPHHHHATVPHHAMIHCNTTHDSELSHSFFQNRSLQALCAQRHPLTSHHANAPSWPWPSIHTPPRPPSRTAQLPPYTTRSHTLTSHSHLTLPSHTADLTHLCMTSPHRPTTRAARSATHHLPGVRPGHQPWHTQKPTFHHHTSAVTFPLAPWSHGQRCITRPWR